MSENYRLYAQKQAVIRATRCVVTMHPLRGQLEELLEVVRGCERIWALEVRIERTVRQDKA